MSSDYERGYEMGLEDGHRCEKRHATIGALEKQVATLQVELEAVQKKWHYAATCDASLDMADQCIALQAELEGVRKELEYPGCSMAARIDLGHGINGECVITKAKCSAACLLKQVKSREANENTLTQQLAAREGQVKELEAVISKLLG